MPGFLKTATVSTAVHKNHNKFDKSSNTITTQNFFTLKPVFYSRMIPNDSINIDASMFCRLMPQVKPIMGSGRIVNRAFFVPWRIVFSGFDDLVNQTPYHAADGSVKMLKSVPFFTMYTLQELFISGGFSILVDEQDDPRNFTDPFDFYTFISDSNTYRSFIFTELGRYSYDLLVNLGYKVSFRSEYRSLDYWKDLKLSALNLLAYAKIWVDWYRNAAYDGSDVILSLFKKDPVVTGYEYTVLELISIFNYTRQVLYDSDYFTAQWDQPEGPNSLRWNPNLRIDDITSHRNFSGVASQNSYSRAVVGTDSNNGTPILNGYSGSTPTPATPSAAPLALSQYIVDALKRATDYVHRRQMVGNRLIDNFLALFGVENSFEKIDRSIVVGHWDVPIRFGEVMATTDNASVGQPLGDYAGKAVGFMEKPYHMNFENHDKHGILMVLSYIEPKIGYVDGIDRNNLDLAPLDFYQGDFDHLGVQATYCGELFFDGTKDLDWQEIASYDSIFGYMPRYAHMKVGHDILSGDFYRPLYKESMKVWHMNRMFDKSVSVEGDIPIHSYNFTVGDAQQFNRIFAIQDSGEISDNFMSVFHFDVSQYSTMSKLWDNYEFDNEEQHRQVVQRINGSAISD